MIDPVAQQRACSHGLRQRAAWHLPSLVHAPPSLLELAESVLYLDALAAEELIERATTLGFVRATGSSDGQLRRLIRADAAAVMRVGDIGQEIELRAQPWHAEVEGDHLTRADWRIPAIDDAEAT